MILNKYRGAIFYCTISLFFIYICYYLCNGIDSVLNLYFGGFGSIDTFQGKLISIIYFLFALFFVLKVNNPYWKLLFIWTAYACFSTLLNADDITSWIFATFQQMLWPITFLFFYVVGRDFDDNFKRSYIFLCVICVFIYCLISIFNQTVFTRSFDLTRFLQVNEIYYILLFIPWVLLIKSPIMRYVLLLLGVALIVFSLKRTAILGMSFSLLLYVIILVYQKQKMIKNLLYILPLIFFSYFILELVNSLYDGRLFERFLNMTEDRGSGRLDIYSSVLSAFLNGSFFDIFFGIGRYGITKVTGGYSAHNEFLEVLARWGILGLLIYIRILSRLFYNIKKMVRIKYRYMSIFGMSIGIFVVLSLTSHLIIYPYIFTIIISVWGYLLGDFDKCRIYK